MDTGSQVREGLSFCKKNYRDRVGKIKAFLERRATLKEDLNKMPIFKALLSRSSQKVLNSI